MRSGGKEGGYGEARGKGRRRARDEGLFLLGSLYLSLGRSRDFSPHELSSYPPDLFLSAFAG